MQKLTFSQTIPPSIPTQISFICHFFSKNPSAGLNSGRKYPVELQISQSNPAFYKFDLPKSQYSIPLKSQFLIIKGNRRFVPLFQFQVGLIKPPILHLGQWSTKCCFGLLSNPFVVFAMTLSMRAGKSTHEHFTSLSCETFSYPIQLPLICLFSFQPS